MLYRVWQMYTQIVMSRDFHFKTKGDKFCLHVASGRTSIGGNIGWGVFKIPVMLISEQTNSLCLEIER